MSKLRLVNAKTAEKLLQSLGFVKVRQKGSHAFYRHPDGRTTTLPHHKGRMLARPLLREILREIELTVNEYNRQIDNL
ncbi:MAG TPA: type II toxin-antitoxin system HicA family toxin [Nitrospirae bacterium]|nr:type II toxin-antitoxin system HicA family toxin [Nitrospirota bacterium]